MTRKPEHVTSMHRRQALATLASLAAVTSSPLLLSACGGGGGDAAGGAAVGQSWTSGPISGLGSIIVNGVRFDDRGARVEDDEDGIGHDARELKLGVMVQVQASGIDDAAATGVATLVRFGSEMKGAVQAIDTTAQTLTVIDQTVEVRPETVFDAGIAGGLAGLAVGDVLEIHAFFNASTGHYVATRIEREDDANLFRLRGVVSGLDTVARTFRIGAAVIAYGGIAADQLPPNLADGMRVRVRLLPQQVNGQWVAVRVRAGVVRVDDFGDARVCGLVTDFTSPQSFSVAGVSIDATNAVFEPGPSAVRLGALVAVRGSMSNGTLVATKVRAVDERSEEWAMVELHGSVGSLDGASKTFMLREVKVDYSRVMMWKNGAAGDLKDGASVEVKGLWSNDRSVLYAGMIEFE
ncbi:MAG TPA: DUF5666 domain-containing protein [Burkholderiaceae bacterium]|nr:DUF5666 domain-containing protein [Burkholderiaceae bacterium]